MTKYILAALAVVNLAGFITAAWDKRAAKRGGRRVPEKRFVLFSVLGGGPGVLLAFYLLRHKTRHRGLLLSVWLPALLETGLLLWALYKGFFGG